MHHTSQNIGESNLHFGGTPPSNRFFELIAVQHFAWDSLREYFRDILLSRLWISSLWLQKFLRRSSICTPAGGSRTSRFWSSSIQRSEDIVRYSACHERPKLTDLTSEPAMFKNFRASFVQFFIGSRLATGITSMSLETGFTSYRRSLICRLMARSPMSFVIWTCICLWSLRPQDPRWRGGNTLVLRKASPSGDPSSEKPLHLLHCRRKSDGGLETDEETDSGLSAANILPPLLPAEGLIPLRGPADWVRDRGEGRWTGSVR